MEFRSLSPALHRASTIVYPDVKSFMARHEAFYDGYSYALYGHPASRELEARIAELEGGARAVAVPSGLAAIALVQLTFLRPGDQVLLPDTIYGPARQMSRQLLAGLDVETGFYDPVDPESVRRVASPSLRLIWAESPGSFTMEVQDIPRIVAIARDIGALVAVDNTWASPLHHKPLSMGADISVQAISKHVAGHGDLILGAAVARAESEFRMLKDRARNLGYGVSPDDCWLALRGLETLEIRLDRQLRSAMRIAEALSRHPAVEEVLFPPLPGDRFHDLWRRDFTGGAGVFSVVLAPAARPCMASAVERLKLFAIGASWGGTRSLVAPADPTNLRDVNPWRRGVVLRFSIGLEDPEALLRDIEQAFEALPGSQSRNHEAQDPEETASSSVDFQERNHKR